MDTLPSMMEEYTAYWDTAVGMKGAIEEAYAEFEEMPSHAEAAAAAAAAAKQGGAASVNASVLPDPTNSIESKNDEDQKKEHDAQLEEPGGFDEQIHRLFIRYDLDGSGTIN